MEINLDIPLERSPRLPSPGTAGGQPPRPTESLVEQAVRYVEDRHWDVLPGAWLVSAGPDVRCSCAFAGCDAPGAHPAHADFRGLATGSASAVRRAWARQPRAAVLLPTGRSFDVLDVPETAGCLALARMERTGVALGPVSAHPQGSMQFFVLPGGAARVPGLLRQLGWPSAGLGLRVAGEGGWVAAPPTRVGDRGRVQWVRRPTEANRWLPGVEEVIAPLAYACRQEAG
ncbi:bifunctional DNA primase/polymerase [Streptomyces hoynatensis]|uniref:bifunctional DNA primase/polymerase n=1 Tax=Streptomyces hoynatensis TaxID=1141874 RepID=UPI003BAA0C59